MLLAFLPSRVRAAANFLSGVVPTAGFMLPEARRHFRVQPVWMEKFRQIEAASGPSMTHKFESYIPGHLLLPCAPESIEGGFLKYRFLRSSAPYPLNQNLQGGAFAAILNKLTGD